MHFITVRWNLWKYSSQRAGTKLRTTDVYRLTIFAIYLYKVHCKLCQKFGTSILAFRRENCSESRFSVSINQNRSILVSASGNPNFPLIHFAILSNYKESGLLEYIFAYPTEPQHRGRRELQQLLPQGPVQPAPDCNHGSQRGKWSGPRVRYEKKYFKI